MSYFFSTTLADNEFYPVEECVVIPSLDNIYFKEFQSSILLCRLNNVTGLFFFLIFFPAIVPDIDEIAAQAETMFAGRYILWNFTPLYICLFMLIFLTVNLCLFCAYFPTSFSSFDCCLLHNLYIDIKVPEKIWISNNSSVGMGGHRVGNNPPLSCKRVNRFLSCFQRQPGNIVHIELKHTEYLSSNVLHGCF